MESPQTEISFFYRNHRGEVEKRFVTLDSLEWIDKPGLGYESGWFLSGFDRSRQARRSFALTNIVLPDRPLEGLALRTYKLVRF